MPNANVTFHSPAAEMQIINVTLLPACPSPPRMPRRDRPYSLQSDVGTTLCVPTFNCNSQSSDSSRIFLKPRPAFGKTFAALSFAQLRQEECSGENGSIDGAIIESYTPLK
jgi:hypothetical protein